MNQQARQKHSQMQSSSEAAKAADPAEPSEPAVDPVCGMDVTAREGAQRLEHDGHVYYFCSAECREQYQARGK